jgi:hypothetical protein
MIWGTHNLKHSNSAAVRYFFLWTLIPYDKLRLLIARAKKQYLSPFNFGSQESGSVMGWNTPSPLLQSDQTGYEAQTAPYSVGTGTLSPGVKQPGHEADRTPPSSARITIEWGYTSSPPVCHGVQRYSFSFTSLYFGKLSASRPLCFETDCITRMKPQLFKNSRRWRKSNQYLEQGSQVPGRQFIFIC